MSENLKIVIEFIKKAFKGMTRLSGEPMESHSIQMAEMLRDKGYGEDYQIVALLHDVLEDTNTTVMEGIFTTSVTPATIDERPMAYKKIEEIISNIQDTVSILEIIKPIYNFKSH